MNSPPNTPPVDIDEIMSPEEAMKNVDRAMHYLMRNHNPGMAMQSLLSPLSFMCAHSIWVAKLDDNNEEKRYSTPAEMIQFVAFSLMNMIEQNEIDLDSPNLGRIDAVRHQDGVVVGSDRPEVLN